MAHGTRRRPPTCRPQEMQSPKSGRLHLHFQELPLLFRMDLDTMSTALTVATCMRLREDHLAELDPIVGEIVPTNKGCHLGTTGI